VALNKLNHIYGEPLVVSSLNTTGDTVVSGSLRVLGSTTLASASIGAVTNAQIQYLAGLTSDVQTQLNGKVTAAQVASVYAPLTGATFTGAISATDLTLTNDLTVANGGTGLSATTKGGIFVGNSTTAFTNVTVGLDGYLLTADSAQATGLKWAAAPVSLPSQTSNSGKFLTTDGTSASWTTLNALPTQTGNSGKYLTTDGTTASWGTLTASNLTGGTLSSTILGNSAVFIGTTSVALNRTTANLALTGITSVAFPGSTSGTTTVQASAAAGTTTFTLPATTGTADLVGNTFFVGTTSIANNRASAAQTLTGVSIDGNAATATNGLTTSNYSSYAVPLAGGIMSGILTIGRVGDQIHLHPAVNGTAGKTVLLRNDGSDYYVLLADSNTAPATASWNALRPLTINTTTGVLNSANGQNFSGGTTVSANNLTITSGNLAFGAANPIISASSYVQFQNGIYVSGGPSLYTEPVISARGGIRNDTSGALSITGGTTGQVNFTGYITIASDKRIKKDIVKIDNALTKVNSLNGYTYLKEGRTDREMGVIAQEVLKVAPELVSENEDDGMLSVSYQNMVALLIEAVKEQSIQIASLEEQVKELKG